MTRFAILLLMVLAGVFAFGQSRPRMVITTESRGEIVIELATDKAPKTTAHIMRLVEQNFYDQQRWFNVVKKPQPFLIQTGDPASKTQSLDSPGMGSGGSGASIAYEDSGMPNDTGYVGLATTQGNPNSGDSQFYILLGPARFLDGRYTVFGRVISGMNVVNAIERGDRITSVRITRG